MNALVERLVTSFITGLGRGLGFIAAARISQNKLTFTITMVIMGALVILYFF